MARSRRPTTSASPAEPSPADRDASARAARPVDAVFVDLFGTLLSLAPLAVACEAVAPERGAALAARWRTRQLEITWLRTAMRSWTGFEHVTADALRVALEEVLGAAARRVGASDRARLAAAFEELPLADHAVDALGALRAAGLATGVLTNGSAAQVARIVERTGLSGSLDHRLSVDAVRVYKPDPRVYALAVAATDLPIERIGFVTANGWDAAGAGAFGFRVAWLRADDSPPMPPLGAPRPIETTWSGVPAVFLGDAG